MSSKRESSLFLLDQRCHFVTKRGFADAGGNFGQYGRPAPPPLPAEESSVVAQYEEEDERMPPRAAGAAPLPPRYESDGVKPQVPYYELPAGIMLPLIKLEDCTVPSLCTVGICGLL